MSFKDLPKRLLSSFVSIVSLFVLIYFAKSPFFQIILLVLIGLLCAFAMLEFRNLLEKKLIKPRKDLLVISAVLFTYSFLFLPSIVPFIVLFLSLFVAFLTHFSKIEKAFVEVSAQVMGLVYIAFPLGLIFPILFFAKEDGRVWLFYLLAVAKSTDIGGYFGGSLIGKKKLAKKVSPKKTLEGAVSGILLAVAISYLFHVLADVGFFRGFNLSLSHALGLGLVLAVFAQIGDLAESLLKRDAKVKDSGYIPGFGGVLDTLDSLLFALPVIYFYLEAFK